MAQGCVARQWAIAGNARLPSPGGKNGREEVLVRPLALHSTFEAMPRLCLACVCLFLRKKTVHAYRRRMKAGYSMSVMRLVSVNRLKTHSVARLRRLVSG